MPQQLHPAETDRSPGRGERPKGVVVFLPGLGDAPEKFVANGFVDQVRELGFDAVTVDAHFGYYRDRILKPRLDQDVIAPLRAKGYRQIWLVGISLGGFGSVIYSAEHPVDGLIVLAPFLGDDGDWGEIEAAGGLARWDPGDPSAIDDQDRRALRELWVWLRGYAVGDARPPLFIGFGDEDRFERSGRLVGSALPPDHVAVVSGGHKWTTWKVAFRTLAPKAFH